MAAQTNWFKSETGDLKEIIAGSGVTPEQMQILMVSEKFKKFIRTFNHEQLSLTKITVGWALPFGSNLGFAILTTDVKTRKGGKILPGAVFLRGDSVAIMVIVSCEGKRYALLTKQFRIPVGGHAIVEAVAGMMDEGKDPVGVAIKEVKEEANVEIKKEDLVKLTAIAPSAGGCDEQITCYYTRTLEISATKLKEIQEKIFGTGDEAIRIIAVPFNTLQEAFSLHDHGDSKINSCVLAMIAKGYFN